MFGHAARTTYRLAREETQRNGIVALLPQQDACANSTPLRRASPCPVAKRGVRVIPYGCDPTTGKREPSTRPATAPMARPAMDWRGRSRWPPSNHAGFRQRLMLQVGDAAFTLASDSSALARTCATCCRSGPR